MRPVTRFRFRYALLLLAAASAIAAPPARAQSTRTVLLVPFTIFSDGDLSFLRKGVQSMLATRLAEGESLSVVEPKADDPILKGLPGAVDEAAAARLAEAYGTDFVAFGTITVLGESISTDARFYDAAEGRTRVTFSRAGKSQGDAILHVNAFAAEVNQEVFGRGAPAVASSSAAGAAAQGAAPEGPDTRQNPEALWRRQFGMGVSEVPTGSEPAALLWKSGNFKGEIRGVAVADVDGDGQNEVVLGGDKQIFVYRMGSAGGFQPVAEHPVDRRIHLLGVEAADINGNGKAEIFVPARNEKFLPSTFVLEWDGAGFDTVEENSRWYYRVVREPGTGVRRLYGQQGGLTDPLFDAVYEMAWSDGVYAPQQKQFVPGESNVFGFAVGDVLQSGEPAVVSFVKGDRLRISLPNGREEWTSADKFGGRDDYLYAADEYAQAQRESLNNPDPEPFDRTWLYQRVIIEDVDKNQKNDVLVVTNHDQTGGLFERMRSFVKGRFECLEWDNVGLQPKWRTRYFTGYISDYELADPDNDGRSELIFNVTKQVGDPITGRKVSYVVVWKPDASEGKPAS